MAKKRTLVVGDIHGGFKSLLQVLDRAEVNLEDKLIFLGDYVDGWSQSAEVIDHLLSLPNECIFLRGNHDVWCEEWLLYSSAPQLWLNQGGKATRDSMVEWFMHVNEEDRDKFLQFFRRMYNYYVDDENRGFVHGGFTSRKGLGHDHYPTNYYWDRDLWSLALMSHGRYHEDLELVNGIPSSRRFDNHKEVYIGHSATLNWKVKPTYPEYNDVNQAKNGGITVPMNRCNIWNLDTGGGFYGKLTIMDVDTKEYWQSDLVRELYPEETGR